MNTMHNCYLYVIVFAMIVMQPALASESEKKRAMCDGIHCENSYYSRSMLSRLFTEICAFSPRVHTIIFDMIRAQLCDIATIKNAHKQIRALTLLGNRRCVSLGEASIKIWNIDSTTCDKTIMLEQPYSAYGLVVLSRDKIITHSGGFKHRMVMYDLLTESRQKISPSVEILSLVHLANDHIAFSQLNTTSVHICDIVAKKRVWHVSPLTLKKMWCLKGHNGSVKSLEFLPDNLLVAATGNWTIKIWSTTSGVCLKTLLHRQMPGVTACRFLSRNILASYTGKGFIKLWNIDDGVCLKDISVIYRLQEARSQHSIYSRPFIASRNEFQSLARKYLVALYKGSVRIVHAETGKCLQKLDVDAHIIGERCNQFGDSGNQLVIGTKTGDIMLYELVD